MRPTSNIRRSLALPDGSRTPLIPSIHTPPAAMRTSGRGYEKLAAFSPSIDAMNAPYSSEQAQAQFDQTITQAGYQRFGSKFPDLVPYLVTLRMLASDVDEGTAFGAFVLQIGDRVVYVPMVMNDSRFEELDIVYDKMTDQFAPLTLAQLRYLRNRGTNELGTAEKLPQSVPTDVDIRALMLPPETGRYSYASAPEEIQKTAGFAANLGYTHPKNELQAEVLKHLAKSAPEVFDHLPEEQKAAILAHASDSDPAKSEEPAPLAPDLAPAVPMGSSGPVPGTIRIASAQIDADLEGMRKKLASVAAEMREKRASAGEPKKLLTYLRHAPNAVKVAFVETLRKNKDVASQAMRFYGPEKLASACRKAPEGLALLAHAKHAGMSETPFRLTTATKDDQVQAFGPDAGKALRGVRLRGYYYRTEGMAPNHAVTEVTTKNVQVQKPMSGEAGAGLTGVLMLRKRDGSREPALVISQPYILSYGEAYESRAVRQPGKGYGLGGGTLRGGQTNMEPEHGRRNLVILGDKSFFVTNKAVFGDPVPDSALEGTALWNAFKGLAGSEPAVGQGMFLSKNGATMDGTEPLRIEAVSKGPDGILRGRFSTGRPFECDPLAAIEKMINTGGYDTLYLPASWKWLPLGSNRSSHNENNVEDEFYLSSEDAVHALVHTVLSGAERASVLNEGTSYVTSAAPGLGKTKIAALVDLSKRYGISGGDAEALLKIADLQGRSSALIVPRSGQLKKADDALASAFGSTLQDLQSQLQQLQGQIDALMSVQQRASQMTAAAPAMDPASSPLAAQMTDPGMGAPAPGDAPVADLAAQAAPPPPAAGDPNAAAAAPAPSPADPNAMAAPAPAAGDPSAAAAAPAPAPADPNAAAAPPAGDPNAAAPMDPNAAAAAASPAPAAPPVPQGPVVDPQTGLNVDPQSGALMGASMATEGPAASQVEGQVNPNYLHAAGALDDAAIFDVGMLAEMQRAAAVSQSSAALDALLPINTKDLAETVDDLGRALLNLYLRGNALNEQLGVQTQARMVGQVRRSFLGLGELLLDLRAYKAGARASSGNI